MPTYSLISTPLSEAWTAWILLLILLLGALANVLQGGVIVTSFTTLLAKPERSYADSQPNILARVVLHTYRLLIAGMALYLLTFRSGTFSIATLGWIMLFIGAVVVIKWLVTMLLSYTFSLTNKCASAPIHYDNLLTAACSALYPVLLCLPFYGPTPLLQHLTLLVVGAGIVLTAYKCIRAYLNSPLALLYILIYVTTLEVLPVVGAYIGVTHIVSNSFVIL